MKIVGKFLGIISILSLAVLSWPAVYVFAADSPVITKQQLKDQKESIKSNSQASRQEEEDLRDRIRQAERAGDKEAVRSLREQLKAMHQENVAQKQQDQQDLKDARQEWNADKKAAHKKRLDANQDGTVDNVERERSRGHKPEFDDDDNPPGPRGGEGTNWENPPGHQGGPGASPDRKYHQNK